LRVASIVRGLRIPVGKLIVPSRMGKFAITTHNEFPHYFRRLSNAWDIKYNNPENQLGMGSDTNKIVVATVESDEALSAQRPPDNTPSTFRRQP
jgi:hypothetical protein